MTIRGNNLILKSMIKSALSLVDKDRGSYPDFKVDRDNLTVYIKDKVNKVEAYISKSPSGYELEVFRNKKPYRKRQEYTLNGLLSVIENVFWVELSNKDIKIIKNLDTYYYENEANNEIFEVVSNIAYDSDLIENLVSYTLSIISGKDSKITKNLENIIKKELSPLNKYKSDIPKFWSNIFKYLPLNIKINKITPNTIKIIRRSIEDMVDRKTEETREYLGIEY